MRVLLTIASIALVATMAAAVCPAAPAVDPFKPSTCAAYTACDTTFCGCVSSTSNTTRNNASLCLAASSANCTTIQTCMLAYTKCLMGLESQRTSTDAACNVTGAAMHAATLAATAGMYSGSSLQLGCRFRVCTTMNASSLTCAFGTNDSAVCMMPAVVTSTAAPNATRYVAQARLRLSGTGYAALLNDPAKYQSLATALRTDLATLLAIESRFIVILNMTLGSLVVDFAIVEGSGKSTAALTQSVQSAANSTSWLTSTKSVYATVSNETITVLGVTVTEVAGGTTAAAATTTAAGATTTAAPGPGTSAPSAASATSVVAVVAAAVAALAMAL